MEGTVKVHDLLDASILKPRKVRIPRPLVPFSGLAPLSCNPQNEDVVYRPRRLIPPLPGLRQPPQVSFEQKEHIFFPQKMAVIGKERRLRFIHELAWFHLLCDVSEYDHLVGLGNFGHMEIISGVELIMTVKGVVGNVARIFADTTLVSHTEAKGHTELHEVLSSWTASSEMILTDHRRGWGLFVFGFDEQQQLQTHTASGITGPREPLSTASSHITSSAQLDEFDPSEFCAIRQYRHYSWMNPPHRRYSPAELAWAKLYDAAERRGARYFVVSTYNQWLFGCFSEGYSTAWVSAPIVCDSTGPNVVDVLMFWFASACGLPGGYVCQEVAERRLGGAERNDANLSKPKKPFKHYKRVPLQGVVSIDYAERCGVVSQAETATSSPKDLRPRSRASESFNNNVVRRVTLQAEIERAGGNVEILGYPGRCKTPEPRDAASEY
ncbi:hypothetical protein BKA62DRAFT_676067 [Auriculariales sp. MPI-PUGE-AT-0066]|nr:hypothetical protein BKA62DRAFT_676067 [Auriculariales sp. MPI-PUGE-AT-0066]